MVSEYMGRRMLRLGLGGLGPYRKSNQVVKENIRLAAVREEETKGR